MKNIPEIRIKGFEGEWKEKLIGDISDSFSGGTPNAHEPSYYGGKIPFIRSGEIGSNKTELFLTDKGYQNSSAKIVEKDTLLYALYGATSGEVAISNINGAINQAILAIYPHKGYDSVFMHYWLKANKKDIISTYLQGGQGNLSGELVKSIKILFPNLAEQQSLGSFFSSFDRLLSDHHRRLENLRRVKKSMLQKMFPQQGQTVPEIRFKGFGGEWEKLLLGDLLDDNIKTNTFSRALLSDGNGEVLDIHYGDILIKFDSVLNVADVKIPHITGSKAKDFNCYLQDGDIIFADTAEDETAGKCIEIENIGNKYLVSGLHTIACRPNKVIGKGFLGYYLNSPNYHNQLLPLMQGIKVFSINKMPLKQTFVQLPSSVDEQRRIGSFLTSLDNLINDEVNYIDQLTRVKSTLLQKMFV